jgi:hypothetical protein
MLQTRQEVLEQHRIRMQLLEEFKVYFPKILQAANPELRGFLMGALLIGSIWYFRSQFP